MSDVEISLVMHECKDVVARAATTEEKLRGAFKAARGHWMVLNETHQFKGALAAVLDAIQGTPDYDRLAEEIRIVGQFNAFLQAAQSGLDVKMPDLNEDVKPFGIVGMWRESQ